MMMVGSALNSGTSRFHHLMQGALTALARDLCRRPWLYIILPFLACGVCGVGMSFLFTETAYEKLWYPTDTPQWRDLNYQWDTYGMFNHTASVILEATEAGAYGGNVLHPGALAKALEIQQSITSLDSFQGVCARAYAPAGPCIVRTVLDVWDSNATEVRSLASLEEVQADLKLVSTAAATDTAHTAGVNVDDGTVLGGITRNSTTGDILGARALQILLVLESSAAGVADFQVDTFHPTIEAFAADPSLSQELSVVYRSELSYQVESDKAIEADQVFVTWAMVLMIVYVSVMLGRCHPVHSRVLLSLSIMVTIGLSLAFAFGVGGYLGLPITTLSLMAIFILLGVGIDDMFILVDAFDRSGAEVAGGVGDDDDLTARVVFTFQQVGASITLTSLTDFSAFMIGSTISIPAIRYFCIVAGLSVLAVFAIQLTFFAAMLVYDTRRAEAGRFDVFFCVKAKERGRAAETPQHQQHALARGMASFGERLLRPRTAVCVLGFFVLLNVGLGLNGALRVELGADWEDFINEGSHLLEYFDTSERYFGGRMAVDFITKEVDVGLESHVAALADFHNKTLALPFVVEADSWYATFGEWLEERGADAEFDAAGSTGLGDRRRDLLVAWVNDGENRTGGFWYSQRPSVLLKSSDPSSDDYGVLQSTRITASTLVPGSVDAQIADMNLARDTMASVGGGVDCIAVTRNYGWIAREEKMVRFTTDTLLKTLGGVVLICLLFLGPSLAVVTAVSVALVNLCLFGAMPLMNIRLNVSSFINLVLAIGFSVDYSAHMAEGYRIKQGGDASTRERMVAAMSELGGSVLNGGLSTFFGVLMLVFSKSAGFVMLFRMFLGMVVFGLAHGLIFVPCVIFLFGGGDWGWGARRAAGAAVAEAGVGVVGVQVEVKERECDRPLGVVDDDATGSKKETEMELVGAVDVVSSEL